eukprot:3617101-Rhodomonas_salina.3
MRGESESESGACTSHGKMMMPAPPQTLTLQTKPHPRSIEPARSKGLRLLGFRVKVPSFMATLVRTTCWMASWSVSVSMCTVT